MRTIGDKNIPSRRKLNLMWNELIIEKCTFATTMATERHWILDTGCPQGILRKKETSRSCTPPSVSASSVQFAIHDYSEAHGANRRRSHCWSATTAVKWRSLGRVQSRSHKIEAQMEWNGATDLGWDCWPRKSSFVNLSCVNMHCWT